MLLRIIKRNAILLELARNGIGHQLLVNGVLGAIEGAFAAEGVAPAGVAVVHAEQERQFRLPVFLVHLRLWFAWCACLDFSERYVWYIDEIII